MRAAKTTTRSLDYTDLGRGLHGFLHLLEMSDYTDCWTITQIFYLSEISAKNFFAIGSNL